MTEETLQELERIADALENRPDSMARVFSVHPLQTVHLMHTLGVDRLGLVRLRLCMRPRNQRELARVARYCGADVHALAALLAEGGAL